MIPTASGNSLYTYWTGHFDQKLTPTGTLDQIPANTVNDSAMAAYGNQTNVLGGGGSSGSGSATKYYKVVTTCQSPAGNQVEVETVVRRGIGQ